MTAGNGIIFHKWAVVNLEHCPLAFMTVHKMLKTGQTIYHADTCRSLRAAAAHGQVTLKALARGGYPGQRLPPHVLPELRSVGLWNAAHPQTWGLDWHRNEGLELTYLARGNLSFAVDEVPHALRKGDLTLCRPWQIHRVGNPHVAASRLYWLILDVGVRRPQQAWRWPNWLVCSPTDQRRLTRLLCENNQSVWPAAPEMEVYFQRLGETITAPFDAHTATRLALHINELLVAILEMLQHRRTQPNLVPIEAQKRVELFLSQIRPQPGPNWNLSSMARQCHLGRSQFSHYCRELTNMTPRQFLEACRVSRGQRLLLQRPRLSITQVAQECGFASSQYFATVFRKHTSRSPRSWRKSSPSAKDRHPVPQSINFSAASKDLSARPR
jgi:AraC family L-rhamnose operon regulatory protein RhaS